MESNPDPTTYKAPWANMMDIRLKKACRWLQSASEQYDIEFLEPALADMARARVILARMVEEIDEYILEDAVNCEIRDVHIEVNKD